MSSVVPPAEDETPVDNVLDLAAEVARLKLVVGIGREDGLRGEQLSITKAINVQTVLLQRIESRLIDAEANRIADLVDAQRQREDDRSEARADADGLAAEVERSHAAIIRRLKHIGNGVFAAVALLVILIGGLFAKGCL